jgi:AraC-like DNA-binding protein
MDLVNTPISLQQDAGLVAIVAAGKAPTAGSLTREGMHVDMQWHYHEMHKLLYAFEGATEVESSHGRNLVPRQLAAWIPAGVPHCTSIHGIRWVSVFFPPRMLEDAEQPVDAPQTPLGRAFFEAMACLCAEWITREANLFLPTSRDARVKRALDYTALHMDANLADVCRHAGMSVRSLRRHLKAETGMTWEEYRHRGRLLQAFSLLGESSEPIGEIAARCGFESPSGFAKAFRAEMGESPRDYRQRVRGPAVE